MPIYEEKLISPLAIRFTQEHIRPVFQDGSELEATIRQITTRPGSGAYDVILEAPFPVIEIMRWRPHNKCTTDESDREAKHWFTLDNRRLYCLQRAAVALWPQRVAVAVEANYAAPEGALRKSDSSSAGRSVGIGHSLKTLVDRWCWRSSITTAVADPASVELANQHVEADDGKESIGELQDAPAPPSMLDLFMSGAPVSVPIPEKHSIVSEGSTTSPSTPRRPPSIGTSEEDSSAFVDASVAQYCPRAAEGLAGIWYDNKGQSYEIAFVNRDTWECWRWDREGNTTKSTLWYDPKTDAISWGNSWSYWAYAEALQGNAQQVSWFGRDDDGAGRPRFVWYKDSAQEQTWYPENTQKMHATSAVAASAEKSRRRRGKA